MASYYKRGNSYVIRVSCGYNAEGKQIYQSMTWKPDEGMTAKQIEKVVNRQAVLFEENCKKGFQCKVVKFETFCEEWFEEYAEPNLRHSTYSYLYHQRLRIYKAIGHIRMDKLTSRQIQTFINSLSKEGANEINGKPLSPKSVRHNLSLISDVFSYAVKMGVVADNPCSRVTLPKIEQKEKQIYTPEEAAKFLELLNKEPIKYRAFFNLAIYSGFRRGELLGLEWKDVDFDNGIISVRRTSCYSHSRGVYTDTTKTKLSQRTLKFPQMIMDLLKELREYQDGEALKFGDKWVETDRLFTKENGEPQHPNTTYHWLERFCERKGLPFYVLHTFRHTFATMALENGMVIKSLSAMLGHISSETTIDIYSHVTDTMRQQAAVKIDRQIGGTEAEILRVEKRERVDTLPPDFEPYKPKIRKSGTGCVTMINDHLYEGRYTPTNAYGKREGHNIYAKTREECEEKLAAMIAQVKAEIKAEKKRLKSIE